MVGVSGVGMAIADYDPNGDGVIAKAQLDTDLMDKTTYDADGDGHVDSALKSHIVVKTIASASNNLKKSEDAEVTQDGEVMTKHAELTVPALCESGTYRIKFNAHYETNHGYARIYKNGVAHGTLQTIANAAYDGVISEDLAFTGGDTIELWICGKFADGICWAKEFRAYCDFVAGTAEDIGW